ncbi:MAG TPA: hypothetical protein VHP81_03365 [Lachnospiraceae bacterium]|nr:hypothetical protein [Lachnospiraceae bacterium]
MPIKIIGFAGLSSKDIMFYCAYMICQCNQKVLLIDFDQILRGIEKTQVNIGEEDYKVGEANTKKQDIILGNNDSEVKQLEHIDSTLPLIENYMGIDYLHYDANFYSIYESLSNEYDFIILDACELNQLYYNIACQNLFNMCEHLYMVTDLRKANLEQIADILKVVDREWNLIYRNICNKRFERTLFHQLYPDCHNIDKEYQLWLDSYDQYYQMCVEYGIRQMYGKLSKDMRRCLTGILTSLDIFSGKQIIKAMKKLLKGGI